MSCSSLLHHQFPAFHVCPYFISSVPHILFVLTSSAVSRMSCLSFRYQQCPVFHVLTSSAVSSVSFTFLLQQQCPTCLVSPYFISSFPAFHFHPYFTSSVQHVFFVLTLTLVYSISCSSLHHQQCPACLFRPYVISSVQHFLFVLTSPSVSSMSCSSFYWPSVFHHVLLVLTSPAVSSMSFTSLFTIIFQHVFFVLNST